MNEPNDHEWLRARERGEDISYVPAATRATYDRLAKLIATLPHGAPRPGWKQRVLASLDPPSNNQAPHRGDAPCVLARPNARGADPGTARPSPTCRHPTWRIAGSATAAAALLLVLILVQHDRGPGEHPAAAVATTPFVTTEVRRGGEPHRGSGVNIGDTLVVRAKADRPIELRVYGDTGEPLARCTETQGCTVARDHHHRRFELQLELRSPGEVRALLFVGDAIPASFQNLNADLEIAQGADVETRQIAVMHVE